MLDDFSQDYPARGTVLDLIAASRADTLLSWVDDVADGEIVVSAPMDTSLRPVLLPVGEHVEIVWKSAGELRSLPAVLTSITPGERPRWQLRRAGLVKRGQRRDAVRAPLTVPVQVYAEKGLGRYAENGLARATTVDISEGGLRCVLEMERWDPERGDTTAWTPQVGDVVRLSATLPDLTITCLAEITRRHPREDARVELSTRFIGLQEYQQDLIRRRVFARLRELRQRGLL